TNRAHASAKSLRPTLPSCRRQHFLTWSASTAGAVRSEFDHSRARPAQHLHYLQQILPSSGRLPVSLDACSLSLPATDRRLPHTHGKRCRMPSALGAKCLEVLSKKFGECNDGHGRPVRFAYAGQRTWQSK